MACHATSSLLIRWLGLVACCALAWPVLAANPAGEVVIARGIATAQTGNAAARILGLGSSLFEGDVITTGPRSVALLKLQDGSRVTLRPQTKFQIEEFSVAENDLRAAYRLFTGGLRAVTGFLSKRNPNAVRLRTAVATIGIRGTEFDARLCAEDCAAEAQLRATPAGRAGFVRGEVKAQAGNGDRQRKLVAGSPIYAGDTLETAAGSYLVIAFKDQSRVTLTPNTEFRVERFVYNEAEPAKAQGFFAFVRGGLRAVSGAIGKFNRDSYRFSTSVATIGIRGTEWWGTLDEGVLNVGVDVGGITTEPLSGGPFNVDSGQMFVIAPGLPPQALTDLPAIIIDIPTESTVPLPPEPPPPPSSSSPPQGLIVSCYEGNCDVETDEGKVELTAGEASIVNNNGDAPEKLPEIPPFMPEDPALRTVEDTSSLNFLESEIEDGGAECTVQ